ncbi:uroporphyrinogen-III synthase [Devosia neptuniae]|jgi:uroporphyrinogen-III synthase|uniref:uroporphyrinogen-III synthase n=1 Tax=Devosia TaxID=46913 RepID=UPI0022AFF436|nr:uroporphyrinogen-III synthase [Devosia neptuniae]MCZ4347332.1 uroporphyrinogen-III synthase [Devosia neptuniae]|tara:strand:- start:2752 stop:3483 length:732 start_codon:yes stop_codon:yes gene_type:complete
MSQMLITRPEPDAQSSLARLQALDIEGVAVPLMERVTLDVSLPPADGFAAVVLTSANAVRTLVDRGVVGDYAHLPVLAVGDRTARDAEQAGFVRVSSAAGAFGDLVNAISLSGLKGPLFYPTGKHQSADLAKALAPMGVMVATAKVYDMVAIETLPTGVLAALGDGGIGAVLVYSRRTAEIFAQLAQSLDRAQRQNLGMLCMSEAVAEPLLEAHFNRIGLADRPDEEAMMALALAFARAQTGS